MALTAAETGNLLDLERAELEQLAQDADQPRYKGRQIFHGIFARRKTDFDAFTDLDKKFRDFLSAHYSISLPRIEREFRSRDGSIRFLLSLDEASRWKPFLCRRTIVHPFVSRARSAAR